MLIFGPFWVIFGPFWQFWVIFGHFWEILGHFWAIFVNFGSFLGHFFVLIFLAKNVSLLFLLLFASLTNKHTFVAGVGFVDDIVILDAI